jgi:hypothetical protein
MEQYFLELGSLAAGIVLVAQGIKNLFKMQDKAGQYVSWGVAALAGVIGYYFQLGMYAGLVWYFAAVLTVGVAFVANGLFDVDLVKKILELVGIKSKV